jgi:DNA-binding MarR family transcriptional regulator
MLFRHVALAEGRSQGDLARAIGLPASRIVALVDRLEARGWIERRTRPTDRRTRSLFLTATGRGVLQQIATVSAEHEAELTRSLDPTERKRLIKVLRRLAGEYGLIEGVHPGFADPNADQSSAPDR